MVLELLGSGAAVSLLFQAATQPHSAMRLNIDIGMWIAIFVGQLLWYPFARKRLPKTRFLKNVSFFRWVLYSLALTGAILIIATPIRALMDGVGELFLILAIATFFIYKAARVTTGSPQPANKGTPGQAVGLFAATMVYAWGTTANRDSTSAMLAPPFAGRAVFVG